MEVQKTLNLLQSIKSFLYSQQSETNTTERRSLHPRILTQEQDGCVLYTWNDFSSLTKSEGAVTHVGTYDTRTQTHKVIWIYNQKIKIVSCSINEERTLLAFTLVSKMDPTQEASHTREKYSAFLAELQATGGRVFSLNLDRSNFLKVQFLYSSRGEAQSSRDSHMLVFLHKESIGLYHVPLARMGDKGVIMSDQPRTEQIIKKFVWCQWDAALQRLHYIQNTRCGTDINSIVPKYSCFQFYQDAKYDNMMDVPLNFPFPYIRSASRCRYVDLPFHSGIPDIDLNFQVLSQPNGTFCLCYQQLQQAKKPQRGQEDTKQDVFDVNYYICMVHHAKTLHGCVNDISKSTTKNRRVSFQWCGGYLAVCLPGVFQHLLNVNIEFDPCHHILLHNRGKESDTTITINNTSSLTANANINSGQTTTTTNTNSGQTTTKNNTNSDQHSVSRTNPDQTETINTNSDQTTTTTNTYSGQTPVQHSDLSSISSNNPDQPAATNSNSYHTPSPIMNPSPHSATNTTPDPTSSSPIDQGTSSLETSPVPLNTSPPQGGEERTLANILSPVLPPDVLTVSTDDGFLLRSLMSCFGFTSPGSCCVYDQKNGLVWKVVLNPDTLLRCFPVVSPSTRLAILHFVISKTKDIFYIKRLFTDIFENVVTMEMKRIMSEYLVASTYLSMKRQLEREVLRLFPFTSVEPYKGQVEKNEQRERIACITYSNVESINITTKTARERQFRHSEDLWDTLRRCLRLKQLEPLGRFHNLIVKSRMEEQGEGSKTSKKEETNFLVNTRDIRNRRSFIPTTTTSGSHSTTEAALGSLPPFLYGAHGEHNHYNTHVSTQTESCLMEYLGQQLKKEGKAKAKNVAQEYVVCQMQQAKLLCHLLWSLKQPELNLSGDEFIPMLNEEGDEDEYEMFGLYERFYLTVTDLAFPLPSGFPTFFTALGFRCLNTHLFLQYVNRGVLQLTGDFVTKLLIDLSDEGEDFDIKCQIISLLPQESAEECFKKWNHPVAIGYMVKQQTAQILKLGKDLDKSKFEKRNERERAGSSGSTSSGSNIEPDIVNFKPLNSFINYLLETSAALKMDKKNSKVILPKINTSALQEIALYHTVMENNYDLSAVDF